MATPPPLVLIVRQFDGQAMSGIRARFGPDGGSIGRADDNLLVLVDPDKTISRVHARLRSADGQWWLRQVGSNPMRCNDQPLAQEQEWPLQHGDWIQIGHYRIETVLEAAAPQPLALDPAVQQAVEALLACFEPAALAEQLGPQGRVDSLLPLTRRARLWEQYEAQFEDLRLHALQAFQAALATQSVQDAQGETQGGAGEGPPR